MKRENQRNILIALCILSAFVLWTVLIKTVDVKAIGPQGSAVGFATINQFFHSLTGVHMVLYEITDWLGLIPIIVVVVFAVLGLTQLVKRKNLGKVDFSILLLGGFYIVVLAVYLFFESYVVNYRPILIDGILEASYPSSTTMLSMCVMPTAAMQLNERINNIVLKRYINLIITVFTLFMVIGRLISGVHWFTDIVGGALLSGGLVMMYYAVRRLKQ